MSVSYQKTGYLDSDFRIFYLTSAKPRDFQSHYHDFHKLLVFESGSVSYYIEGETYQLQPYDIVLVPAGEVHRPVIHDNLPYRRLILYLSPSMFDRYRSLGTDLGRCFALCPARGSHILRIGRFRESRLYPQFRELAQAALEEAEAAKSARLRQAGISAAKAEISAVKAGIPDAETGISAAEAGISAVKAGIPGAEAGISAAEAGTSAMEAGTQTAKAEISAAEAALYRQSVLLQFLSLLNRMLDGDDISFPAASGSNPQILQVLSYISDHLTEDLCIDRIADACYLNRSYLMHLFRRETGYTLGSYIAEKRLFTARTLIQSGVSVTEASLQSGFTSYAAFYRSYRRKFGEAPKDSRGGRKTGGTSI